MINLGEIQSGFNGAQHGQKSFIKVSYTSENTSRHNANYI